MKILEKNKAIGLRKNGKTFSEILQEVPVTRGSLSHWLRDINLTSRQILRIRYKNDEIKKKFIQYNALKKKRSKSSKAIIFKDAAGAINNLSQVELKLVGIALYWAEGCNNSKWGSVCFTNSDARMIRLMMSWFRKICKVPEEKFRIRVQCHGKENAAKAQEYWSQVANIPLAQFTAPYTRVSPTSKKKVGNLHPNGICNIRISDIALLTKIKGWIKGLGGAIV
ncbi:hypothetical protein ACFL1K_02950 [Candidatus Omnitrophota bacterium]